MENNLIGTPPDMEHQDKVELDLLEMAMDEYYEGIDKDSLEGEIQVMLADPSPIDEIDILYYVCTNSKELTKKAELVELANEGYTILWQYASDDTHVIATKIPDLDKYVLI